MSDTRRKNSVRNEASSNALRAGIRAVLPLVLPVAAFGISFGVLARAAGFGRLAAIAMSATTFAGSSQFAAVSVLGAAGGAGAAIAAALLLNSRYAAISVAVGSRFHGSLLRRLLESQLLVDESWAVSVQPDGGVDKTLLVGAGGSLYLAWTGGTVVGAFVGDALGSPATLGLDGAFPALFFALLVAQLGTHRARAAALGGAAVAAALVPFVAPGLPIVAAAGVCLLGWRRT